MKVKEEVQRIRIGICVYRANGMYEVLEGPFKGERGPMIAPGNGWLTLSIPVGILTINENKVKKVQ